jgi:trans-aconitate methyltransferase
MEIDGYRGALYPLVSRLREVLEVMRGGDEVSFEALDPDLCVGRYSGETDAGSGYICRGWNGWVSLASSLGCTMLTPDRLPDGRVKIRYRKLLPDSFHTEGFSGESEKYGIGSRFEKIRKWEEPSFHIHFREALERVGLQKRRRVLDLGVNRGDEFAMMMDVLSDSDIRDMEMVGIDHSASAISEARRRFADDNVKLYRHDISDISSLNLGRFDLIVSIATLQSPSIPMKRVVMELYRERISQDGAFIFGFPNSRWTDGELIYGAVAPNYPFSELSLVIKDIYWIKKYLQQHRYRVILTGREYLFLTALKIGEGK